MSCKIPHCNICGARTDGSRFCDKCTIYYKHYIYYTDRELKKI